MVQNFIIGVMVFLNIVTLLLVKNTLNQNKYSYNLLWKTKILQKQEC